MKIATFGTKNYYTAQLPRIESAFISLGHSIVNIGSVDLIYSNDPGGFDEAIRYKEKFGGKLILNILDRPWHCKEIIEWDLSVKNKLQVADIVTSISKYTQQQVLSNLNIKSNVIYQPIKPVYNMQNIRTYFIMAAGRLLDPNKRFYITKEMIEEFSKSWFIKPEELLSIFGSEPPRLGSYYGIVNDKDLNLAYNLHKFCMITSLNEGLCLPMIESIVAGCIPIVCSDMTTAEEFAPKEFIFKPDSTIIGKGVMNIMNSYDMYSKILEPYTEKYRGMFSPESVALNILNLV